MNKHANHIYLDFAAASPVRSQVKAAMEPYWQDDFANPQSVHLSGQRSSTAIKDARNRIAKILSVQEGELVFTSGATEANSLALLGATGAAALDTKPEVLISEIAHGSVLNASHSHGSDLTVKTSAVDKDGRLDPTSVYQELTPAMTVVSCSHANSEIGTLQPIRELAAVVRKWRQKHDSLYPLLHVDASQTALYENIKPESLGVDLLTLNAAKIYGPKGVGLLWIRSGTPMSPLMIAPSARQVGDYQKLRPGTLPTPLVVGFAEALTWAQESCEESRGRAEKLRDNFIEQIQSALPDGIINGSRKHRVAHNISLTLPDADHDFLAVQLSQQGVDVATTSACQTDSTGGSKVLRSIGGNQALRFTLGLETTQDELDQVIRILRSLHQ